jgi:hypothetical protein
MTSPGDVTLFIDPFTHHFLEDRLFEPRMGDFQGDDILAPWIHLRRWFQDRGIRVFTADRLVRGEERSDVNVYVSFGMQEHCRALAKRDDVVMSAYFAFEGPIVDPTLYRNLSWVKDCVRRVYSFSDAASLAPFLSGPVELLPFRLPSPVESVEEQVWQNRDRQFLAMINANKAPAVAVDELYTERLRAVEFFGRSDDVDLYGVGWNVPPYKMGGTWMPYTLQRIHRRYLAGKQRLQPDPLLAAARRAWRGTTESKCETLGSYTFALCFENQLLRGWITEKIFDCFRAGSIPIYLGAPDIEDWVPSECFIDMRQFTGYGELGEFLRALAPAEIERYREAARDFLASERFYPFSKQAFVDRLAAIVEEDTGLRVG